MRRATAVFRAANLTVIPAPARSDTPRWLNWRTRFLPSPLGMAEGARVSHELAGLLYYEVKGWR